MKESHVEGKANHDDPESCTDVREDGGEALTGACTGRVLSREMRGVGRRRRYPWRKATSSASLLRDVGESCAVEDPVHVQNLLAREPGDLWAARSSCATGRVGKAMSRKPTMHGPQKSDRLVVPTKSSNNVGPRDGGDGGGKELG